MILELFQMGGPIMWPILICSVVALAVVVDRVAALARAGSARGRRILGDVLAYLDEGRVSEGVARCTGERHPVAVVMLAGLKAWDLPPEEVDRRMEAAGAAELESMEAGLPILATLIGVLPQMGFLGTVWGLILALMEWSAVGTKISIDVLATGMYQAMITTASGLVCAIPYLIVHNLLTSRIAKSVRLIEAAGSEISGRRRLAEPREAHAPEPRGA